MSGYFKAIACFQKSLVEWSSRRRDGLVKKRSCMVELYKDLYLTHLFRETVAKGSLQKCINPLL